MIAQCQRQPYLQTYHAKVLSCTLNRYTSKPSKLTQKQQHSQSQAPLQSVQSQQKPQQQKKKKQKTKQKKSKKNEQQTHREMNPKAQGLYEITLSDTILFAEGGGQPSDTGMIDGQPVLYVYRDVQVPIYVCMRVCVCVTTHLTDMSVCVCVCVCVHSFPNKQNQKKEKYPEVIIHLMNKPIAVGKEVDVKVNWVRRYDHMQHHSAQHLISAIARTQFGWNTVSWWLSSYPEPCNVSVRVHICMCVCVCT